MDIYIQPRKKAVLTGAKAIYVRDVAAVVAKNKAAIDALKICGANPAPRTENYLVAVSDIIRVIKNKYPNATVNNVGEMNTLVSIAPASRKSESAAWNWAKVAFVALILAVGSATAIMSYHTDGQIPKIFERFYLMFYGYEVTNPRIITIPYSVGLALGIIVFYNHFFTKKLTDDPTPIEVEMELYENDVTEAKLDMLAAEENDVS